MQTQRKVLKEIAFGLQLQLRHNNCFEIRKMKVTTSPWFTHISADCKANLFRVSLSLKSLQSWRKIVLIKIIDRKTWLSLISAFLFKCSLKYLQIESSALPTAEAALPTGESRITCNILVVSQKHHQVLILLLF